MLLSKIVLLNMNTLNTQKWTMAFMLSQGESILFNVLYCQKVIYLFSVTFSVLQYLEADLINFHVE